MAKSDKKPSGNEIRSSSSMAIGKGEICRDAACIADIEGKMELTAAPAVADSAAESGDRKSSRSSMSFGKEEGCRDEECIGIK
jgi:hypothetical protein